MRVTVAKTVWSRAWRLVVERQDPLAVACGSQIMMASLARRFPHAAEFPHPPMDPGGSLLFLRIVELFREKTPIWPGRLCLYIGSPETNIGVAICHVRLGQCRRLQSFPRAPAGNWGG